MVQKNGMKDMTARLLRGGVAFVRQSGMVIRRFRRRFPSTSRVLGFALSALLTVTVVCTVFSAANLTYALEVKVNGTSYGYVESRTVADEALADLCSNVEKGDLCAAEALDTELSYGIVSRDSLLSGDELINTIVGGEDDYRQTVGVFANGRLVSYCNSAALAQTLIGTKAEGEFFFEFEYRNCVVKAETFDELYPLSQLDQCVLPVELTITCEAGDTAQRVADRLGVSEALILGINPSATYETGSALRVVLDVPVLATITTAVSYDTRVQEATDDQSAALLTETIETDSLYGVPYRSRVVAVESKELTENKPVAKSIVTVGNAGFCWPLDKSYRQYVSSYWGDGRGHQAVDIAGNTGIPILSVLDGTVVSINSSGSGYGQHFVIDHGNGLKTLYAHCSKVYVKLGETVSRGEVVGLVGSTGYSTGSHLHFEVIRNGARVNPCSYLGI